MGEIEVTPAREAAFTALLACEKQGAWSDQAIKNASKRMKLTSRDAALAANLCYGVVQNQLLLDAWIDRFSSTPAHKLEREARISLRMGLYQLHFLDRVPPSAAVNESVNLTRRHVRSRGAAGLVNAVLRAFQRSNPEKRLPECADRLEELSLRYSHPLALTRLLADNLGADVEPLLAADNRPAELTIQVNTRKTTAQALTESLQAEGVAVEPHPWLPDCLFLKGSGDLERLQAPGGKSLASAIAMDGRGEIISCDIQEKKLKRIEKSATRMGLDCIRTQPADGRRFNPEWEHYFDVVLADVPCSGLGIIRKKPDIRYKDLSQTENLPAIQLDILRNVSRYVRPDGVLLYSTCTVLERENQAVVNAFLSENPSFRLEPSELHGPVDGSRGFVTLWPHIHGTDGFFFAKLRRSHE